MHAGQLLFKSTPANPCKDHLILVEYAHAGWRGATATNCVGLALKVTVGCSSHSAVVGDAITIGGLELAGRLVGGSRRTYIVYLKGRFDMVKRQFVICTPKG